MNIRKVAGFAFGPISTAAVGLITVPLTAWYFSAEDIGKISMLQIAVSFCLLFFSLGLDQAYVREYHDKEGKQSLFIACISPGLTLLVFALAVLFILNKEMLSEWLFETKSTTYSAMVAICILAAFVGRFLALILRMQERGWAFSISQLLPKIVFLALIMFFITCGDSFDLHELLMANTVAFFAVVVVFSWNTRHEWRSKGEKLSEMRKLELLKFGLPLVVSGVAFWGMTSFDKIFLKQYSSFEQVGLYSVISSFAGVAVVMQNIFTTVWAPTAYKWNVDGMNQIKYENVVEWVLAVVVLIFSLAGALSWCLSYVLPIEYQSGQYIFLGCLIYPLLYSLSETTGIGLGIARKSGWSMVAMLMALVVNAIGNICLVPIYGASGAAVATGISFFTLFVLRTELSNIFWKKTPRFRVYIIAVVYTACSVFYCLHGAWLGYFGPIVWVFLSVISAAYLFYRGESNKNSY